MAESETKEKPKAPTIKKGVIAANAAIALCGVPGVGKTTQAIASSANTVVIDSERGSHWLPVDRIDVDNWKEFTSAIQMIAKGEHQYDTIVFDSWDRLCEMLDNEVVAEAQKTKPYIKSIGDFDNGQGYVKAGKRHGDTLDWIDKNLRGKYQIIVICHVQSGSYKLDPTVEPYNKFTMKMRDKMGARLREWSDFCLFANFDIETHKTGKGWEQRVVAQGDPMKRWVHTAGTTYFDCKSRIPLLSEQGEPVFEFTWENIEAAMKRGLKK